MGLQDRLIGAKMGLHFYGSGLPDILDYETERTVLLAPKSIDLLRMRVTESSLCLDGKELPARMDYEKRNVSRLAGAVDLMRNRILPNISTDTRARNGAR